MEMIRSNDFTNVKVGDKVITNFQFYPYPQMYMRLVEKVTKTTFTIQGYNGRPGSGKVYKKNGKLYPAERREPDAIVWTQEIQDEYDAFVANREDRLKLRADIDKILNSLVNVSKRHDDNATTTRHSASLRTFSRKQSTR